jgi:hypothetical protein
MAINPHRKGGVDVPIEDGGTDASDASTALTNLGGGTIKTAKRSATSGSPLSVDNPSSLRGEIAFVEGTDTAITVYEDAGADRLVVEISATSSMQVSLTASGGAVTSHNSGALGFTPQFAFLGIHAAPWTNITVIVGTGAADRYTTRSSNNDNWVGSLVQGVIDQQDWTCSQFTSAGVIVGGTNAHNLYMLVVGQ